MSHHLGGELKGASRIARKRLPVPVAVRKVIEDETRGVRFAAAQVDHDATPLREDRVILGITDVYQDSALS